VKKTGAIALVLLGITVDKQAGRQAGRQNSVEFKKFKNYICT